MYINVGYKYVCKMIFGIQFHIYVCSILSTYVCCICVCVGTWFQYHHLYNLLKCVACSTSLTVLAKGPLRYERHSIIAKIKKNGACKILMKLQI